MKYENDEIELLNSIENNNIEKVPFDNQVLSSMANTTLEYMNEKKQISINLKRSDLDFIKQRANDIGISYQNIIQTLVHNYSTNKLQIQI
ncbi:MAG: hypothetical protein U9N59_01555 [Campylobacterota bacterium]|nr:hypothetical protein [Campylobacterota bacterium]